MIAENPALHILMNEDLYLTSDDSFRKEKHDQKVLLEEQVLSPGKDIAPDLIFAGKNLKNFLILTNEALQEGHLKALENTLLRKQLSLEDVAVVDFAAYEDVKFEQINASFMPLKLVCFGLKPEILGLPETTINQIKTNAACRILFTYSFTEMLGNKEKTKAFWEVMKVL